MYLAGTYLPGWRAPSWGSRPRCPFMKGHHDTISSTPNWCSSLKGQRGYAHTYIHTHYTKKISINSALIQGTYTRDRAAWTSSPYMILQIDLSPLILYTHIANYACRTVMTVLAQVSFSNELLVSRTTAAVFLSSPRLL